MAIITLKLDTESETISGDIDGKEFPTKISSVSICNYCDYKNKPCLSWNICVDHETDSDDFRAYTNFSSASIQLGIPVEKAQSDINSYFDKKSNRR